MSRALAVLRRTMLSEAAVRRLRRYFGESERPVHALLFLLPWVVLYEGWSLYARAGGGRVLLAHSALRNVFEWFGIGGFWVPGVVLVVALLVLQRRRHERWRARGWVPLVMVVESVLLALPLLVVAGLFAAPQGSGAGSVGRQVMQALGAGIYEELVFRLLLIAGLIWLLRELLELRPGRAVGVAVPAAAVVFALCHFEPVGVDPFRWTSFWFRFVAGLYLSVVYLGRGLGLAAGAHAAFNAALVLVR